MHSAVVFYSLEGNTRAAAELVAGALGAELYEVKTTKVYPKRGLAKFFVGGKDSTFGSLPPIEPLDVDLSAFELVVLALPVWAGKAAAPINTLLKGRNLGSAKVALVIASASGDAASCVKDLAGKLGRLVEELPTLSLKDPGKMDRGELGRLAEGFARELGA